MEEATQHFKKRLAKRFALGINTMNHDWIVQMIQNQDAIALGKKSKYRSEWLIEFKRIWIRVIYSNKYKKLITALPLQKKHYKLIQERSKKNELAEHNGDSS